MHRIKISSIGNVSSARSARAVMSFAAIAVTAVTVNAGSASAQATSPRGAPPTVMTPPHSPTRPATEPTEPTEPRLPAPPMPKRGARLRDAEIGKRALQLSPVQEQAMAAVRDRYSPGIKSLIARLNALMEQQATTGTATETVKATEDTLRHIIGAEHAALDSLISPDQRQRFLQAMRQAHAEAPAPPPHSALRSVLQSVPHSSLTNH